MLNDIQKLAQALIHNLHLPKLQNHRNEAKRIARKYSPREVFNRWRDSEEGQVWKNQQFQLIAGKCPFCENQLPDVSYFEIDHIKPLSSYPNLAVETSNLRLLCSPCNRRKSNTDLG